MKRRLFILTGLGVIAPMAVFGASPEKEVRTLSGHGVDRVKLVRPQKHVTLLLTAGAPLQYGTWTRSVAESNQKLQYDSGLWENWLLGDPGGGSTVRLYTADKNQFLLLHNYTTENSIGGADFRLPDSGGDFGSDPCQWFRL